VIDSNWVSAKGLARGGVVLLALAGGFFLISLPSIYTEGATKWKSWPLFPGFFDSALLMGETGLQTLQILGFARPVILILAGLALILRCK
jgi:hypothetical protein